MKIYNELSDFSTKSLYRELITRIKKQLLTDIKKRIYIEFLDSNKEVQEIVIEICSIIKDYENKL